MLLCLMPVQPKLQKLLKMDLKRERSTTTPQTIDLKFDGIDGPSNESAVSQHFS